MKLAHIVYQFPKLSETFILNQITGLYDQKILPDIFAFKKSQEKKVHEDVFKYNLFDHVTYFEIPDERLKRLLKVCLLGIKKPKHLWLFLKAFRYFYKSIYYSINDFILSSYFSKNYDIVHCHYGTLGKRFLFLKYIYTTKLVVSFHGFDITKIFRENNIHYYDDLFKAADIFLPISNHWCNKLIDLGCPPEKIIVHRMGIDIQEFRFKPRSCSFPLKILTIGRLVEKKGIPVAIRALAKILAERPNFTFEFWIAGDGPLRKKIESLIENLNLSDRVRLLGWVNKNEVRTLMDKAHIFLLPSLTAPDGDQEGIPVVLMEAMASGLPVISTFHSGIPELVLDGKTGFLVPENDIAALAAKIIFLVENPQLWAQIAHNARKFVEQEYNIKKQVLKLLKIYKRLLAHGKNS